MVGEPTPPALRSIEANSFELTAGPAPRECERDMSEAADQIRRTALADFQAGLAAQAQGDGATARARYRAAWDAVPGFLEAACNLAVLLCQEGALGEAEKILRAALTHRDDVPQAHAILGQILLSQARAAEALPEFDAALAKLPDDFATLGNRAQTLLALRRGGEALAAYEALHARDPNHPVLILNYGGLLAELGRTEEAEKLLAPLAAADHPLAARANISLGVALLGQGRHRDARAAFERAGRLDPADPAAGSGVIFAANFDPDLDDANAQALRRDWARRHAEPLRVMWQPHANPRDPYKRLVVGYVSGDFRDHAAAGVIEPILAAHDKNAIDLVLYSNNPSDDTRTDRFKAIAGRWRDWRSVSDDDAAQGVRADGVDILVDLSGHTGGNRLPVFARKPAPIQMTGWGDANGTGLTAIDYLFTDPVALPPVARGVFAEAALDLPNAQFFKAPDDAPEPQHPPRDDATLYVGTFNRVAKLDNSVLRLWARILAKPGRRLVLKDRTLAEAASRARIEKRLAAAGIDPAQADLVGPTTRTANYADYARLDVALDPFPYGGGLTTLDALWMGVPLVSLRGRAIQGRLSASILTAIGRAEWIAETPDDYVRIAESLLADAAARKFYRSQLRDAVRRSAVGDVAGYARAVEAKYREIWAVYCARPG
jgi:protein O-GlcNAc transferase